MTFKELKIAVLKMDVLKLVRPGVQTYVSGRSDNGSIDGKRNRNLEIGLFIIERISAKK